jgi:hypothetical protein
MFGGGLARSSRLKEMSHDMKPLHIFTYDSFTLLITEFND